MKYSDETIEAMALGIDPDVFARDEYDAFTRSHPNAQSRREVARDNARAAIEALESTDDMKALRADAESHRMRMKNCDCQQEGLCHYCRTGEERGA